MNIILAGPYPPFQGGAAILNAVLAQNLADRGHSIRILSSCTEQTRGDAERFDLQHPAIVVRRVSVPNYLLVNEKPDEVALKTESEKLQPLLIEELDRSEPDAVILGREPGTCGPMNELTSRKIPFITILHGGIIRSLASGRTGEPLATAQKRTLQASAFVVPVSPNMVEEVIEPLGLTRCHVIPNASSTISFRPGPRDADLAAFLAIRPEDIVVAHVSNLKRVKAPLDFIHAAALSLRSRPDLMFLVVGDGECRQEMQATASALGIAGRVRFSGWVDHVQVPKYMRLADIVVMPSETEARSLACLEALASGRALVTTDIPASRGLVEHEKNGLLVPVHDRAELARSIVRLAADEELRAALGRNARSRALRNSTGQMADAYEELLLGIIRANPDRLPAGVNS